MIVLYTNQPITPGMIVCRRSKMLFGFASPPVTIVKVSGSRATVRDRDGVDRRIDLSTISFIVDTEEEGVALLRASVDFLKAEYGFKAAYRKARTERRKAAIEAAIGGSA